jgi:hypothetical protein
MILDIKNSGFGQMIRLKSMGTICGHVLNAGKMKKGAKYVRI